MESFRRKFPAVPLIHFLNPAYFTKSSPDKYRFLRRQIRRVIQQGDELGLHLHGWKSLVQASGVTFRGTPRWDGVGKEFWCFTDCGYSVPISSYSFEELRRIMAFSRNLLEDQGFPRPRVFRAGGWMANDKLLRALVAEGFFADSSAIPAVYLKGYSLQRIRGLLGKLWPEVDPYSQPFRRTFPEGSLFEFPNNGALADYIQGDEMFQLARELLSKAKPGDTSYLSIGFHQETALSYLPRVETALERLYRLAASEEQAVSFVTTLQSISFWKNKKK